MAFLLRVIAGLLLVGVVAASCCHLQPDWLADLGLDVWNLPDLLGRLRDAEERREVLAQDGQRVREGLRQKEEAIEALGAGRLTLAEAVESFRRSDPEGLPNVCRTLRSLQDRKSVV